MKDLLKLVASVAVIAGGGLVYSRYTDENAFQGRVEASVKSRLSDPESAIFEKVEFYRDRDLACGEVNARNTLGGFNGPEKFAYFEGITYMLTLEDNPQQFLWVNHQCLLSHVSQLREENPGVTFENVSDFKGL